MSAKYRFLLHWRSCLLNTGCLLNMGYAKYRFHCSPAAYNFTWPKYNNYKHTWKVWFQKISIPFSRRVFRFEPPLFRKFHFNFKSLAFDTPPPEFPVTIHGVAMDIFVELHTCNLTSICLLVWWMCLKKTSHKAVVLWLIENHSFSAASRSHRHGGPQLSHQNKMPTSNSNHANQIQITHIKFNSLIAN